MVEMTAKKEIFYVRKRPAKYPLTQHQKDLIEASKECGVRKGMKRAELLIAMTECIPSYFQKKKELQSPVIPSSTPPGEKDD
jgi:hypothetical protein